MPIPGLRADLADGLGDLVAAADAELPAGVAVLCRRRVVALLDGSGDLADWPTDPLLGDGERACLAVAESLVLDAHSVTDDQVCEVARLLGPGVAVALLVSVGMAEGTARAERVLA